MLLLGLGVFDGGSNHSTLPREATTCYTIRVSITLSNTLPKYSLFLDHPRISHSIRVMERIRDFLLVVCHSRLASVHSYKCLLALSLTPMATCTPFLPKPSWFPLTSGSMVGTRRRVPPPTMICTRRTYCESRLGPQCLLLLRHQCRTCVTWMREYSNPRSLNPRSLIPTWSPPSPSF